MKHFSDMRFYVGYEKNMSFLVISKSPKVGKRVDKIGLGSFNTYVVNVFGTPVRDQGMGEVHVNPTS